MTSILKTRKKKEENFCFNVLLVDSHQCAVVEVKKPQPQTQPSNNKLPEWLK
jgi:hypothetical protein